MAVPAPFDPVAPTVHYRRFDDIDTQRSDIYNGAAEALRSFKPISNATHTLELADVGYDDGEFVPGKQDEKKAILSGSSLQRPLRGTLRLVENETGNVLDEQRATLARVPHLNSRGLFIRKGVVWSLRNQARLRPGVYTRRRNDGGTEAHFNVRPGTGRGFRILLEPDTGLFKIQVGQSTTRLYPVLRRLGIDDDQIRQMWGDELYEKNFRKPSGNDYKDMAKLLKKLGPSRIEIDDDVQPQAMREILEQSEVDPDTTELTLGERISNLGPEQLLRATGRILQVNRGESDGDNRDSQAFQSIHSAEDYIRERLARDQAGALRILLWKAAREGKLGNIQTGLLDKNIGSIFEGSGLAMAVEDINPFEIHDQRQAVTRLGAGGISSEQAVSRDARGVQASYIGVIDAGRGPESSKLGLDLRVTDAALKGSDNKLYTQVIDARTGEPAIVSARDLSAKVVTFPGELEKDAKRIPAIKDDKIQYVLKSDVDYAVPSANDMMSRATAMIPFPESIKGQRLLMGARMTQQALPLKEAEAPLVQTAGVDGKSLYQQMGAAVGAAYSPIEGVVTKIDPNEIHVTAKDGSKRVIDLYNNYPAARKTVLHNTPIVKKGDYIEPGQLVARSNFTDDDGTAAIGRNLRVAFMAAEGDTIEDAFVISESAARKLTSEAMYKSELDLSDVESTEKNRYKAIYTDKYSPEQYDKLDENGIIREGAPVEPGDPLILGISKKGKKGIGALMSSPRANFTDRSQTWEHHAPGIVTDVVKTRKGIKVTVKSYDEMRAADKLTARYGNKGVISEIRPDDQMPVGPDGQPIEVIANSLGIISRVNPAVLAEALLGKVATNTGKPYIIKGFGNPEGVVDFALNEALKHGVISKNEKGEVVDTETLVDPRDGREIHNVFTGVSYFMKPHHMAESKLGARDVSSYTLEGMPARGGKEGSKRIAMLDAHALLSAGATEFLKDAKMIRGQRNDEYWRALKAGETPLAPTRTFADAQFKALLKGAGVNLRESGTKTQLSPMLDADVDAMAVHEIENPGTFNFETMEPVKGGLFDVRTTGGTGGERFAKITLPKKIPHPMFTDPIQKLLGITGKRLDAILSGQEKLHGETGPDAIEKALSDIDIDLAMAEAKETIRNGRRTHRDNAVKRLNYLVGLKKLGVQPSELMITKIPVIPPKYRPVVQARNMDMVHDLNYLYHDLLSARDNYVDAEETFGDAGEEYLTMMNAVRAISGIREPVNPKTAEQNVKGILRYAIGVGTSPKRAFYQRKIIGSAVDTVGRGVITADSNLDMDEVGIPADMAWKIFRPFVIRRLARQGMGASEALKELKERTPRAKAALEKEMDERPVVYNRAPALHRYAYVGAWGKLRDDDAIGMPYHTLKGIGGDFDGDAINIHVPTSPEAVEEVKEKLFPSKNLFHTASYETHLEPMQDYLAGLYLASVPDPQQEVKVFASEQEAKNAYARGEISARTPIRILS